MKPLAAITGGTGFLGHHVLKAMLDAGWRLRLLVRSDPRLDIGDLPVELVPGDLGDQGAMNALVHGADVIIHMAGAIKARNRAGFVSVNSKGTQMLAQAWQAIAPSAKFVMLSSLAAREPDLSHYAFSKAEGEAAVMESGKNWCILRPAAIYGPGDRETLTVFHAASLPFQPLLNDAMARICLVHVHDVVIAVLAVSQKSGPSGLFEVTDAKAQGYQWSEIVSTACQAVGSRYRPIRIPGHILRVLGRIGDFGITLSGSEKMLTSQKVREILHVDWSSAPSRQLPDTIWCAKYGLEVGFTDAVTWYREAGWLR